MNISKNILKVKNEPLVRDCDSNAILFINNSDIQDYERKKQIIKEKQDFLKNDISTLQQEIIYLKTLIFKILKKINIEDVE